MYLTNNNLQKRWFKTHHVKTIISYISSKILDELNADKLIYANCILNNKISKPYINKALPKYNNPASKPTVLTKSEHILGYVTKRFWGKKSTHFLHQL